MPSEGYLRQQELKRYRAPVQRLRRVLQKAVERGDELVHEAPDHIDDPAWRAEAIAVFGSMGDALQGLPDGAPDPFGEMHELIRQAFTASAELGAQMVTAIEHQDAAQMQAISDEWRPRITAHFRAATDAAYAGGEERRRSGENLRSRQKSQTKAKRR